MNSDKTIIVTGGAGFIGSHTIIELLETTDFNIVSIDNFSNSSSKTFDRIKQITGKTVKNYNIDLCDKSETEKIMKQKNVLGVIHFAAFKSVGESVENPNKYIRNNMNSLHNMVQCCLKYSISNFIFSSSCSVYGNIKQLPVKEDTTWGKAESPYALTKQDGETELATYALANAELQLIALRYFNPVGAHSSGLIGELPITKPSNLVPIITQTAIGKLQQMAVHGNTYDTRDGTCIRDYVHVSDIANAHVKALMYMIEKRNKTNFSVFNLGTGKGVSVLEAIAAFEKISGKKLNYSIGKKREGDVEAIYSDSSKAEKELGWKVNFSLDDMMQTAWKWEMQLQKENK